MGHCIDGEGHNLDLEGYCRKCDGYGRSRADGTANLFQEEPENRRSVLVEALDRLGIKADEYGMPEDSFTLIAALWNEYLGMEGEKRLTPDDVPAMLILLKLARKKNGAGKRDNWRDIAGYSHCGDVLENGDNEAES